MADATLQRVLEEVNGLTSEERAKLRQHLDTLSGDPVGESLEDQLELRLVAAGLLSEMRPPASDRGPHEKRRPAKVTGKPVSEFIIEERR